jgi:hypothetical protein
MKQMIATSLLVLALSTAIAAAHPASDEKAPTGYVAANLIPDAPNPTRASAEVGYRIDELPLFLHAELGTGAHRAAAGLEARTRTGMFCGYRGVDAGYAANATDPIFRAGLDIGGELRVRLGVDTSLKRVDDNTISPIGMQLKVGLAYVF